MKMINKALLAATVAVSGLTAASAANAVVTVYTSQAAFTAAITGATNNTFPFAAMTEAMNTYTRGAVTFNSTDMIGFNDGEYGTGISYLGTIGTVGISSTTSAAGFFVGAVFGTQPISYSFGGTTGTFSVPGSPTTSFIGFVNSNGALTGSFTAVSELDFTRFITGTAATSAVPETATWGMMIAGFGIIGAAMRTRRRSEKVTFA